jgi:CheY-like chemotaxis protein
MANFVINGVFYDIPLPSMTKRTILIIDDDPEFRCLLQEIVGSGGYSTLEAKDGSEGLSLAREAKPDMILLDIEMPGMNGYEVCKAVRADPAIGKTPVLLVTVHSKLPELVKGLKAGANDHLTKPFDPEEVLLRIRGVFKAAGTVPPPAAPGANEAPGARGLEEKP